MLLCKHSNTIPSSPNPVYQVRSSTVNRSLQPCIRSGFARNVIWSVTTVVTPSILGVRRSRERATTRFVAHRTVRASSPSPLRLNHIAPQGETGKIRLSDDSRDDPVANHIDLGRRPGRCSSFAP